MSTFGSRDERGHTFSVPHRPTGITGAPVIAASRAAPQRPLSIGFEERRTAWDRALRHDRDHLATGQRVGRRLERLVGAGAAIDADAAHRLRELTDHRNVEHLLLARGSARCARSWRSASRSRSSRSTTGGWRRRIAEPRSATFSTPSISKRAYGTNERPGELHRQPLQLEPDDRDLHDPRRHVEVEHRPPPGPAITTIRGSGLTTIGNPTDREQRRVVHAVGVGVALVEVDVVFARPTRARLRACRTTTRTARRACRRTCRRR